jgi:hypothetical protein
VDVKETTTGNAVSTQAQASLTQNTICGAWTANSTHAYTGVALTAGNGLQVIKNTGDVETATHVDIFVQYTLS